MVSVMSIASLSRGCFWRAVRALVRTSLDLYTCELLPSLLASSHGRSPLISSGLSASLGDWQAYTARRMRFQLHERAKPMLCETLIPTCQPPVPERTSWRSTQTRHQGLVSGYRSHLSRMARESTSPQASSIPSFVAVR